MVEPVLIESKEADLNDLAECIRVENNDNHISPDYLHWWFFENPSKSFSLWHGEFDGKVVGLACTNNFIVKTKQGNAVAAMPQKVLTSRTMRGKGLFGKLYAQTEKSNLENGVDFFLTITNEASTPIFLKKFGYARGMCPEIILVFSNPKYFLKNATYEELSSLPEVPDQPSSKNEFVKSGEYFKWRYARASNDGTIFLAVKEKSGELAGFAVLKKIYKQRLPLYVLLDSIVVLPEKRSRIIEESMIYVTRKFGLGLLALETQSNKNVWRRFFHRRIKDRFNFLVKGKDESHTKTIAETKWDFSFGDMDFI
ncbi:MAG: hypothetical protein ACK5NT_12755 [Pyrinomonadaceae bacterium]